MFRMNIKQEVNTMRQLLAILLMGTALAIFGLVTTEVPSVAAETARPLIKCETCGAEFTSQAGLVDHLKANPSHKAAAMAPEAKPLIKCSTCGVEFTSQAGMVDHLKAYPTHKQAAQPLIKCSTCGVEFTTLKEVQEHLKAHPEHQMAPME